jgi:AcrR family transcriptional regulator
MPKAFSEQERQIIGQRLLEQGYAQFSSYGLKKTSIEGLAVACGISKAAFYLFYESKEALFMDVIEEAEKRMRVQLLATIDRPGPTPRARLYALLKKSFDLFESIPLLQFMTGNDYDLVFRRVPAEKFQEHLVSDKAFFEELIARCRQSGIPIQVSLEQLSSLLYTLVLGYLHKDDLMLGSFNANINALLELVAAYCLGEVELQLQPPAGLSPEPVEGNIHDFND